MGHPWDPSKPGWKTAHMLWLSCTAKTLGSSDKKNSARRSVGRNTTEQSKTGKV